MYWSKNLAGRVAHLALGQLASAKRFAGRRDDQTILERERRRTISGI
jgi:hypothetical protein